MIVDGRELNTIGPTLDGTAAEIIDQTLLPHRLEIVRLATLADAALAISSMQVRGAPLIGVTAAYGLWLGLREDATDAGLSKATQTLAATRPTAINLRWALERVAVAVRPLSVADRAEAARVLAGEMRDEDGAINAAIGDHGLAVLSARAAAVGASRERPLAILTHCNAGWLACTKWGTATAPIYKAQQAGLPIHVFVDETRPRNQGASLTAWELGAAGVPHTVIADNTGGHLMQHGRVDLCIVGTDRVTARGDVCNKIGTYLKALAAADNGVPFYVALPSPTIDWSIADGLREIPIEERDPDEVSHIQGLAEDGRVRRVRLTPPESPALNYGFDVTPARLVTALFTERGVCAASAEGLLGLFPERRTNHA